MAKKEEGEAWVEGEIWVMFYSECFVCNDIGFEVSAENPDTGGCLCVISRSLACKCSILYPKSQVYLIHSSYI